MSILNENTLIGASAAVGGYEIDNSLRFNAPDSSYLSWTPSSTGNNKTWTYSVWIKQSDIATATGSSTRIFEAYSDNSNRIGMYFDGDSCNPLSLYGTHGSVNFRLLTNACYRDFGGWMHIVLNVDTTQSTASNRIKLYINGEQITSFSTSTYPALNATTVINTGSKIHTIGAGSYDSARISGSYFNGYLAEVNFIDGQALTPDSFGETGDYGEWLPKKYTGTYGTNGFYLDFKDAGSLGNDAAGSNNWTPTNLAATDQMLDSPTNNCATLNPLAKTNSTFTLSEGNLKVVTPATGGGNLFGTIATPSTNKWYFEVDVLSSANFYLGLSTYVATEDYAWQGSNGVFYSSSGNKHIDGSTAASYGASYTTNDIIGVAVDTSAGTVTFYKNNSSQGAITHAVIDLFPCITDGASASGITGVINFGQDSSFAGNKTAQGNSDSNGVGDFYYAPPTGFLALCTKNLPDATVVPSEHFNTVLYTGNGASLSVTGVGFQPDFTWIKSRSGAYNHEAYDSMRGVTKRLMTNITNAESTSTNGLTAFLPDGFTQGGETEVGATGDTYAAWNWKAGGTGVSNTDGTITSTVSANVNAGFSIISYTGSGSAATIGTGLSQRADLIITKGRSNSGVWPTWHKDLGGAFAANAGYLYLNGTGQAYTTSVFYDGTGITSSVYKFRGGNENVNQSSRTYISYAFHSVDGYSKVGSYTGNGSSDGPMVYTGFRPAFVMIKRTDSASSGAWNMWDNARGSTNPNNTILEAQDSASEVSNGNYNIDFTATGFKVLGTYAGINSSSSPYIYLAFAESPFKHSNAR